MVPRAVILIGAALQGVEPRGGRECARGGSWGPKGRDGAAGEGGLPAGGGGPSGSSDMTEKKRESRAKKEETRDWWRGVRAASKQNRVFFEWKRTEHGTIASSGSLT